MVISGLAAVEVVQDPLEIWVCMQMQHRMLTRGSAAKVDLAY
jgi:hypothetical protein